MPADTRSIDSVAECLPGSGQGGKAWVRLRLFAIAASGIIAALVLVEVAFRLYMTVAAPVRWSDRPRFFYVPHRFATLQDYPHPVPKAPQTFRIAVVGDSFTFGPKLQFDDTFPKRLERILSMNPGPLKAEVLNLGVSGYGTADETRVVKDAIDRQSDLVILEITLNDPEPQTLRPRQGNARRFGPLEISKQHNWLLYYWKSLGYVAQRIRAHSTHRRYRDYFFNLFENPATWEPFKASLQEIARLGKEHQTKIAAVLFPLMSFGFDDNYPFFPLHRKVAALMEELEIPTLDLFDTYRGIPPERLQVVPVGDPHPNEIAHRLAAEKLYVWLAKHAFIPESLRIADAFWLRDSAKPYGHMHCNKHKRACFGLESERPVRSDGERTRE